MNRLVKRFFTMLLISSMMIGQLGIDVLAETPEEKEWMEEKGSVNENSFEEESTEVIEINTISTSEEESSTIDYQEKESTEVAGDYDSEIELADVNDGWTYNVGVLTVTTQAAMDTKKWLTSYKSSITTVVIEDGVISIPSSAFEGCKVLQKVILPESIVSIGGNAFYNCNALKEITFPENLSTIGNYSFYKCNALKEITFPDNLSTLGSYAFYGCSSLKEIVIPQNVSVVGASCFSECTGLTSVTLEEGVQELKQSAFYKCTSLEIVNVPTTLKIIDGGSTTSDGTFYNCESLKSVNIPSNSSLTLIGDSAFLGCSALTSFFVPKKVKTIGQRAFQGCNVLRDVKFEDDSELSKIESYAFVNCDALENIEIPKSVQIIGLGAFKSTGLKSVNFEANSKLKTIEESAFAYSSVLEEFEFVDGLSSIESRAFYECKALKKIIGPSSVVTIGDFAFSTCNSLTEIIGFDGVTSVGSGAFNLSKKIYTYLDTKSDALSGYNWEKSYRPLRLKYDVVFNTNGGSGEPEIKRLFVGDMYGEMPVTERVGYKFIGWFTSAEGGTEVTATTCVSIEANHTLYAHWEPIYKVSFDSNGGSRVSTVKELLAGNLYGELPRTEREGYKFIGWFTSVEGGTEVTATTSVSIGANHTLHAHWEANKYIVSFDINGGNAKEINDIPLKFGGYYGKLPVVERDRYRFIGWFTDKEAGNEITATSKVQIANNHTLYAHWVMKESVPKPVFSIPSGMNVNVGETVEITSIADSTVYYSTDGSDPIIEESYRYKKPIKIDGDMIIKAIAVKKEYNESEIVTATYTVVADWGDVIPTDRVGIDDPQSIPEKMWVAGIKDVEYTGKAITQSEIRVYDYNVLLKDKVDYTIKYSNNVKAGKATVTITGKGNYTGSILETFTINPVSISNIEVLPISVLYNRNKQKVNPSIMLGTKKLVLNKDYVLLDDDGNSVTAFKEIGEYNVNVEGILNYTGSTSFKFIITSDVPSSKVTIVNIKDVEYTGNKIEPVVSIKYKNSDVTDKFDVVYINNKEIGNATAIIVAKEGLGFSGVKTISFKIVGSKLTNAKLVTPIKSKEYDGLAYEPAIDLTVNGKELIENADYTIEYFNNINVGTAKAVITGIGQYSGTKTFTYRILQNTETSFIKVNDGKDIVVEYEKSGVKPHPIVTFDGKELVEGTDYTLSYVNINAVADKNDTKAPTINIVLKGNYKGKVSVKYTIVKKNLTDIRAVTISDKAASKTAFSWKQTTAMLYDTEGKRLTPNTDYIKSFVYYKDYECTQEIKDPYVENGTTVYVKIEAAEKNYTGEVVGFYRVIGNYISSAKVSVPVKYFTGAPICPRAEEIKVVLKNTDLKPNVDFIVVPGSYSKNISKGTASMQIKGIGIYGGYKTITFKINAKSFVK